MSDSEARSPTVTRTDWRKIHASLGKARASLESGWQPSAEEKKRVLRARAEKLSQAPLEGDAASESLEVVEFLLGKERYAIESEFVVEIFPLNELTPLPCTPPFIAGIINVRGRIVSVVHLKDFFDLPQEGLTNLNRVIILQGERMEFGLLVDAILHAQISLRDIQPPLPTFTGLRAKFTRGVTKDALVVLNAEQILRDESLTNLIASNG
jgi:purine-binding chemotaxis protein CheW